MSRRVDYIWALQERENLRSRVNQESKEVLISRHCFAAAHRCPQLSTADRDAIELIIRRTETPQLPTVAENNSDARWAAMTRAVQAERLELGQLLTDLDTFAVTLNRPAAARLNSFENVSTRPIRLSRPRRRVTPRRENLPPPARQE